MRFLAIIAVSFWFVTSCHSQGTLNFANFAAGVDAPIIDHTLGDALASGDHYIALLYVSAAGVTEPTLFTLVGTGVPFSFGAGAGYFFGGEMTVPFFAIGSTISVMVRVFDITKASTYANSSNRSQSNIIQVTLGGGQGPSSNLVGLLSFGIGPTDFGGPGPITPEPSTIAVGILGVIVLLLRPRAVC